MKHTWGAWHPQLPAILSCGPLQAHSSRPLVQPALPCSPGPHLQNNALWGRRDALQHVADQAALHVVIVPVADGRRQQVVPGAGVKQRRPQRAQALDHNNGNHQRVDGQALDVCMRMKGHNALRCRRARDSCAGRVAYVLSPFALPAGIARSSRRSPLLDESSTSACLSAAGCTRLTKSSAAELGRTAWREGWGGGGGGQALGQRAVKLGWLHG